MPEKIKDTNNGLFVSTKHQSWKWIGALVMTPKTNAAGETHLAVSLTKGQKLMSLVMAVFLFTTMLVMWIVKPEMITETHAVTDPIPDSMLYTLWGLLGLTGVNMVSGAMYKAKDPK